MLLEASTKALSEVAGGRLVAVEDRWLVAGGRDGHLVTGVGGEWLVAGEGGRLAPGDEGRLVVACEGGPASPWRQRRLVGRDL